MTRRQRDNHKRLRQYRAFPIRWILGAPVTAEAMRELQDPINQIAISTVFATYYGTEAVNAIKETP